MAGDGGSEEIPASGTLPLDHARKRFPRLSVDYPRVRFLVCHAVPFFAQTVPQPLFKSSLSSIPAPSRRKTRSRGLFGSGLGAGLSRLSSWF